MAIEVASAAVRITPDFTGFAGATQRGLNSQSQAIAGAATQIGGTLTRAVTLPIAAIGAASVKSFADFDSAITQSLAIVTDFGSTTRADFEKTARSVAKSSTFTAAESGEAFFFLASAGLAAEQQIAALPQVAQFAQAGMFDLATATDLATDAQSALGLAVEDPTKNLENMTRVTDVLVKANTIANASVEQFATSLTNKAATALKLVNKDIEEGVAVLAVYADQGIKGQIAGENLSRVLKGLQINAVDNAEAFADLNIEVFDQEGNMRNLADIVEDVTAAFEPMNDEQKTAALNALGFTARQQDVIKTLIGTEDQIRKYEDALRDAGGITKRVAENQLQSFSAQMSIAKSRIADVGLTLGKELAPAILGVTQFAASAVEVFAALPGPVKRFVGALAGIAALAGPLLLIGGSLAKSFLAIKTLRAGTTRGVLAATQYAAAQSRAAAATGALGAAASRSAVGVGALSNAQLRGALVPAGGGGFFGKAGKAAGGRFAAGLSTAATAGAAGLGGFLAGDLVGGLVQGIHTEEGTVGDTVKDVTGNAIRFGATGAAIGFTLGGPIGAGIGAAIGGIGGGILGFFRSNNGGDAIESASASVRDRIATVLGGLELSERETQAAASILDSTVARAIQLGIDGGLGTVEAAGLGDKVEQVIATLLERGTDPSEIGDLVGQNVIDGLNAGLSPQAIADGVLREQAAREAVLAEGGAGAASAFAAGFDESLQPAFSDIFREMTAGGASAIDAFRTAIDANARDIDLTLVADTITAGLQPIPSIFEQTFEDAKNVSTSKMLELVQENKARQEEFVADIRTLTEAGLVTLAATIAEKGPAAANEASALADDLSTALQIEATLRGISQDDIDAFLNEFKDAEPEAISSAFIDRFVDPLTDERAAEAARQAGIAVDEALASAMNGEIGNERGTAYINGLRDGTLAEMELMLVDLELSGGSANDKLAEIMSSEHAQGIGASYVEGLSTELDTGLSATGDAVGVAGGNINDTLATSLGVSSPSTITRGFGQDYVAGLDDGLKLLDGSEATVGTKALAINQAMASVLTSNAGSSIGSLYAAGFESGFISRMNTTLSRVKAKAEEVNTVVRRTVGIRSPSTIAQRIGEQYIEGLNIGLATPIAPPKLTALTDPTFGRPVTPSSTVTRTTNITINNPTTREVTAEAQKAALLDRLAGAL